MKITNGCLVELELEVRDSEGEVVLSTEEDGPIEYLHGGEDLPMPGLERALETDPDAALALSLLLVAVSAALLFALRRRWFPLR